MSNISNPKDPLRKVSPAEMELFRRFRHDAHGQFTPENVTNAAMGMMLLAMRQSFDTKAEAVAEFDRVMGRARQLLEDHYFPNGSRRPNFAWDQQLVINSTIIAKPKVDA